MLELKDIKKTYTVGDIQTKALDGISVAFREKEFVAILGASGSGKTTCLNIIGGLDRYDEGSLNIKGKNTSNFKEKDWDAYRNNSIGFVFQSYNLITHLSIVANVELGMTLSGVSKAEKRQKALEVLEQVGLKEHLHKKPNQLSGGQMQRVAIARALANNPEILLCDEPTGALDSVTSRQIMDLIQSVSKDRLVIMVTHNPEIADAYADRIIKFEDGKISSDTNPHEERAKPDMFNLKKTAMSFITALNLSGNNILTKKGRTFLTAFASSIGIIGIAVILSLSNGFQLQIDKFQSDAMSEFPILITNSSTDVDVEEMQKTRAERQNVVEVGGEDTKNLPVPTEITVYDPKKYVVEHNNNFSEEYLTYLNDVDPEICSSIGYVHLVNMNVLRKDDADAYLITFPTLVTNMSGGGGSGSSSMITSMSNMGLTSYPKTLGDGANYLERNYELLYGEFPSEPTDLIMLIGNRGRLSVQTLEQLGFEVKDGDKLSFEDVLGAELKLIDNNDFYGEMAPGGFSFSIEDVLSNIPDQYKAALPLGFDKMSEEEIMAVLGEMGILPPQPEETEEQVVYFSPNSDYQAMWDSKNSLKLKITGVARLSEDSSIGLLSNGLAYSDELCDVVIKRALKSDIVKSQNEREDSVFPSMAGMELDKDMTMQLIGGEKKPYMIMLYPTGFEQKDRLVAYLDDWNDARNAEWEANKASNPDDFDEADNKSKISPDAVIYTDLATTILGFMSEITDAVTVVLIAFAAISLVVSLIMISIITYTSVLERTKEIGILRALGARKKDITRVFDAETFIIGLFSGLIGVIVAYLLTFPANVIIENMTNLPNVAQLNILHVIALLILSTALTVLGGHLPARMASKKDAVEALRSE